MNLKNKIVLITGASSGIGEACAEVFAEAGANLVLLARRENIIRELSEKLIKKFNIKAISLKCDVRDYSQVDKIIAGLPEEFKSVDVLINNAGLAKGLDKIQDAKIEDFEEMVDTNIKGVLYFTKLIVPEMIKKGSGMIINMASLAGREVYPGGNVYCATKSALRTISRSLQVDLNGTGIRITNLDPGAVETDFSNIRFRGDKERAKQVYKGITPLTGRDIAEIALFCASRPDHVSIQDVLITPTAQANAYITYRKP
jgi:3-hydroxy acid dehydrogenase / malonic semialdehyde reductase